MSYFHFHESYQTGYIVYNLSIQQKPSFPRKTRYISLGRVEIHDRHETVKSISYVWWKDTTQRRTTFWVFYNQPNCWKAAKSSNSREVNHIDIDNNAEIKDEHFVIHLPLAQLPWNCTGNQNCACQKRLPSNWYSLLPTDAGQLS